MTEPQDSTHPAIMGIECYGGHSAITYRWRGGIVRSEGPAGRTAERVEEIAAFVDHDTHLAHARYLGADAALTNVVDHHTMSESDARSILSDVDPEVMDRYAEPNLSGEWADDPTPRTLVREIVGAHSDDGDSCLFDDLEQAIADAWEEGRDAVWSDALQATALRVLGDIARALEVEAAYEATVASLRAAAGL